MKWLFLRYFTIKQINQIFVILQLGLKSIHWYFQDRIQNATELHLGIFAVNALSCQDFGRDEIHQSSNILEEPFGKPLLTRQVQLVRWGQMLDHTLHHQLEEEPTPENTANIEVAIVNMAIRMCKMCLEVVLTYYLYDIKVRIKSSLESSIAVCIKIILSTATSVIVFR